MLNRHSVSNATAAKLDTLLKQAGEAERAGDLARSFALGQEAWDSLPGTKADWDFYPQIIARGMLRKSAALKDRRLVGMWLDRTYDTYADPARNNHFVNMLEGAAWLATGDDDAAYAVYEKIYERDGRAGFRGDDQRHLDWFLKEEARRRG